MQNNFFLYIVHAYCKTNWKECLKIPLHRKRYLNFLKDCMLLPFHNLTFFFGIIWSFLGGFTIFYDCQMRANKHPHARARLTCKFFTQLNLSNNSSEKWQKVWELAEMAKFAVLDCATSRKLKRHLTLPSDCFTHCVHFC